MYYIATEEQNGKKRFAVKNKNGVIILVDKSAAVGYTFSEASDIAKKAETQFKLKSANVISQSILHLF